MDDSTYEKTRSRGNWDRPLVGDDLLGGRFCCRRRNDDDSVPDQSRVTTLLRRVKDPEKVRLATSRPGTTTPTPRRAYLQRRKS